MTMIGRVLAVLFITAALIGISVCRFKECRKVGHSFLYCIDGSR